MAALTVQSIVDAGTTVTYAAAAASSTADIGNGHNTFLVCRNTTGSAVTFSVLVPGNTFFGQPEPDNAVTVPATTGVKWVPLRKDYDDGTGSATVTTSAQGAGIDVALVRVG